MQRLIDSHSHIFILTGWFNFANDSHFEDVRRRLQATDDNERDGSDSNCSDSGGGQSGGAFRPTGSESPKESSRTANSSYPSPNISVGPPIQPPPHILPYLYPHGIYNHVTPPLSLLHNPAMNPGLFLNAQLALAAQHPAFFGHYSQHAAATSLHNHMKSNRFSPYSLPGFHNQQGSAFDTVTPSGGVKSSDHGNAERSLSSSPSHNNNHSPASNRPQSISPTPSHKSHKSSSASAAVHHPSTSSSKNQQQQQLNNGIDDVNGGSVGSMRPKNNCVGGAFSELKNIEKMVNGLEMHQSQNGNSSSAIQVDLPRSVSPSSVNNDEQCKRIVTANHDH